MLFPLEERLATEQDRYFTSTLWAKWLMDIVYQV